MGTLIVAAVVIGAVIWGLLRLEQNLQRKHTSSAPRAVISKDAPGPPAAPSSPAVAKPPALDEAPPAPPASTVPPPSADPPSPGGTATDFFDPPTATADLAAADPGPAEAEEPAEDLATLTAGERLREILDDLGEDASVDSTAGRSGDPGSLSAVPPAEDEAAAHLEELRVALESGKAPRAEVVEALAADPITRRPIYLVLKAEKKASLIPQKLRTRKAMAEADFVNWVVDSDLGAPPDAVEEVEVVSEGGWDWYLYRFEAGDRGPMAGASGPWKRKEGPGGEPRGQTGSDLTAWNDAGARGWVRSLVEGFDPKKG